MIDQSVVLRCKKSCHENLLKLFPQPLYGHVGSCMDNVSSSEYISVRAYVVSRCLDGTKIHPKKC